MAGQQPLHAELGAILGLERSVTEGATSMSVRVGKDSRFRLSKPVFYVYGCDAAQASSASIGLLTTTTAPWGNYEKVRILRQAGTQPTNLPKTQGR